MIRVRVGVSLCLAIFMAAAFAVGASAADPKLTTFMDGKSEVPKKGDPDGHATITFTLSSAKKQICFDIRKTKLETAAAAHIHKGVKGKAGDVVVPLLKKPTGAGKGKITGCAKNVSKTLIKQILAKPSGFYGNIHTVKYGDGAVRGQLKK